MQCLVRGQQDADHPAQLQLSMLRALNMLLMYVFFPQVSAEAAHLAAEAEEAVTEPIWFFIAPGRKRREIGPSCVRELFDHLTK